MKVLKKLGGSEENRTLMMLPPADFESTASTSSATFPKRKTAIFITSKKK